MLSLYTLFLAIKFINLYLLFNQVLFLLFVEQMNSKRELSVSPAAEATVTGQR
jgi:diacylglycerol kinase